MAMTATAAIEHDRDLVTRHLYGDPEAFDEVYERFKGKSSLKTWVYSVSINCCRSRLGRRSRRGGVFVDVEEERFDEMPSTGESTDARLARREAQEALARALAQLPLAFREAVILRDVSDLSYEEIATVLGLRIGTVRSRIARGRNRLRTLIDPPGGQAKGPAGQARGRLTR